MAETARFVLVDGEMFIKEEQLPQRVELSLPIERGLVHPPQRVRFNSIDLSDNASNVVVKSGRHLP
jgi:hypothetical protein